MHLVVWGSILVWFILIPITSSEVLYSDFFQYGGVAYEVLSSPNFWFYLPLAAIIALLPTIVYRFVSLYRDPKYVDFVRLKEKREGKKLFKRKKMTSRSRSRHSMLRTGYAFSHQHGFGALISSGHIFGMNRDRVSAERTKRYSQLTLEPPDFDHPVSMSQAVTVTRARESKVKIDVVEAETGNTAAANADTAVAMNVDAVASLSVEVHTMSPPTEELEMVVRTDRDSTQRDSSVEQTDLVIVPRVSIPGLVESPDATNAELPAVTMDEETEDLAETPTNLPVEVHEISPPGPTDPEMDMVTHTDSVEQTDSAIVPPVSIPGLVESPDVTKEDKEPPEEPAELAVGLGGAVDEEEDKPEIDVL